LFSHVTVGTNDFARAIAFHDRVLEPLGIRRLETDMAHGVAGHFTAPETGLNLRVLRPIDGRPASVGHGVTAAFEAPDRAKLDRVHAAILAVGGTDEGAPGLRPHDHADCCGAYARDPDGNRICCVRHRPPA
jgi:catechol 2,3-dioxygenase-like lactoylglutathione lyase family enzyme